jgi:hypothetical protein
VLLLALGLALSVQFVGQAGPIPNECMVSTTTPDASHVMNVSTGEVFAVVLDANPTTGYS